ncbi:uncharacterized protein LOC129760324 isoform X2 [Uranotaenia lowii]|uniref:uncharacterized protein LOC129760324 isoform X2 n=1 Tax=Uranotaenia lowii TaxID=190385 RepID=UPI00247890E2|nr:uncharacterized protein LOC129760324 isoform X2 [Uranotaenia lowii]
MNNFLVQISSLTIFLGRSSEAIPVPNRPFGERNVGWLGILTCLGLGAAIGLCVFCKKKKGQFKKFENDGNIEEVKNTEYPILKSLNSLDPKKTGAIIPSSPTNLSTDNLLDQTVQYQNELVSSHDLDGIENYHLLKQYHKENVPKKLTVEHVGKSTPSTSKLDLHCARLQTDDTDSHSNMLLSSKESLSSVSAQPSGTKTSYSNEQETASLKNSTIFGDEKPLIDRCSTDIEIEPEEDDFEDDSAQVDMSVQPPTRLDDVTISISERASFFDEPTSGTTRECGPPEDVTPMDSLEDNSSVHETNSIEEALRALDFAIDGEDESDDSEEEPSDQINSERLDIGQDAGHRRAELRANKNSSSDSGMDEIDISEKVTSPDSEIQTIVREEATKLVDEILVLCQSRIAEMKENEQFENKAMDNLISDEFDDFTGVLLECSTPFVAKKIFSIAGTVDENIPAKQALFCDVNDKTYDMVSDSMMLHELNKSDKEEKLADTFETFKNEKNTVDADISKVDDLELEQIFPLNKTVSLAPMNTTHTLADPSETFVKDHTECLPSITIEGGIPDEVSEKPTATPMNTPIELGCPTTADWDKWLTASASTSARNDQELCENDYFSSHNFDEGWFLHAQPGTSTINEGNETYDLDDNNDNLDETYDLLRKQLVEMLPHAQGAKDSANSATENDHSPNHYGIQYGDLDEATNAPSTSVAKDNEMIINYKRTLSPIMEESEDESFYNKTSFCKEASHFVESTSTGCMESLTAMGVNRTLMASNDTLFNFDDVLDEILSPRVPSQSHTPTNRDKESMEYFARSPRHDPTSITEPTSLLSDVKFPPPKSLELVSVRVRDSSLSSPGDPTRKDFSQDSTFTLDEKTCISLSKPNEEDERISEISEPVLVSSSSYLNKPEDNSLMDDEIASIEDDSFDEILEREKPLEDEHYNHFLDLCNAPESVLNIDVPEPDENFDPGKVTNSNVEEDAVYIQNKLNLENTYGSRSLDEQGVIESIDRFLLKSRNVSLPEDKSTNPLVNGHLNSCKLSSRSDGTNICINYDE